MCGEFPRTIACLHDERAIDRERCGEFSFRRAKRLFQLGHARPEPLADLESFDARQGIILPGLTGADVRIVPFPREAILRFQQVHHVG